MDRQSTDGDVWLGANPSLPDQGPRWRLRREFPASGSIHRYSRPSDVSAFTLAKRLRRTADRLDPQGMPRPYGGVRRTPSAPCVGSPVSNSRIALDFLIACTSAGYRPLDILFGRMRDRRQLGTLASSMP